jgi:apolipoprotein N-acyltransferase
MKVVPMRIRDLLFAFLSAVLLFCSFPKVDFGLFARVCLAPLLIALRGETLKQAFLLSCLTGSIESPGVFSWILYVAGVNPQQMMNSDSTRVEFSDI